METTSRPQLKQVSKKKQEEQGRYVSLRKQAYSENRIFFAFLIHQESILQKSENFSTEQATNTREIEVETSKGK